MEKRTFIGMVEAGEPLIRQALDAMRQYLQTEASGEPPEEVERLRRLAESLFQADSETSCGSWPRPAGKTCRFSTRPLIGNCPCEFTLYGTVLMYSVCPLYIPDSCG